MQSFHELVPDLSILGSLINGKKANGESFNKELNGLMTENDD